LCALAIEYVDERVGALRELHRVLRPGGTLVLSRLHPTAEWLRHGGDHFASRVVEEVWPAPDAGRRASGSCPWRGRARRSPTPVS
jgi:ubiquinone/menaquinone biosynthesis C-methylase UbiE